MKCTIEKYTAKGNQDIYEDCLFADIIRDNVLLCIIADGMGGLDHASDASKFVVEEIQNYISKEILSNEIPIRALLSTVIEIANERIYHERNRLFCKMGTAVAVLLCYNRQAYISWLGDVRVYLVQNNNIFLLTKDHTIQNLKNITVIDPERFNHILTRYIKGSDINNEIPFIDKKITSGDRYILCSDGFYNSINIGKIPTIPLENIINEIGNPEDDYSVIEVTF